MADSTAGTEQLLNDYKTSVGEEMATHSSIPAWRIPWIEELGGLQSTGSQRGGQDWATKQQQASPDDPLQKKHKSKGHRSHLKGSPNGHSWNNLSNKINNDNTALNPQEKIIIH